jgi:hypothetical protein
MLHEIRNVSVEYTGRTYVGFVSTFVTTIPEFSGFILRYQKLVYLQYL